MLKCIVHVGATGVALLLAAGASAVPTGIGYTVSSITVATDDVIGDVVTVGGSVFVGVGAFAPNQGKVIRIDDPGLGTQTETVIADGFTSLAAASRCRPPCLPGPPGPARPIRCRRRQRFRAS